MTKKPARRTIRRSPRIQVTLTPEVMSALERIAKATGQRVATMAGELIEAALPAIQVTEQALKVATIDPREAQRQIANFGADAVGQLMQAQLDLDAAVGKIDGRTVKGRRLKGRARGPTG